MADNQTVELYIYDLTSGMAAMMSQVNRILNQNFYSLKWIVHVYLLYLLYLLKMLLGRHIEGVWHTAVVAYGREFFYGGSGIQSCMPVSIEALSLSIYI